MSAILQAEVTEAGGSILSTEQHRPQEGLLKLLGPVAGSFWLALAPAVALTELRGKWLIHFASWNVY